MRTKLNSEIEGDREVSLHPTWSLALSPMSEAE